MTGPEEWQEDVPGRVRLGIRRRFFPQRVVEPWNRLSREAVTEPSLTICKKHLDNIHRDTVRISKLSCAGTGVGLNYPCGFLPTQDILGLYEKTDWSSHCYITLIVHLPE